MIKYLSLFSGIGAFEKALDNIRVKYELVNYCEVDKYASKAYSLIHNVPESMNLGDITKVDETKLPTEIDLMTYGFPCQDISSAGLQKGLRNEDGSKTRSGLFFDAIRIMKHCKPRIAIAENVKNLTSKRMSDVFDTVLSELEDAGYNNYWQVLNAADYGMPQGRERVFIISIRKDIDDRSFHFPPVIPLTKCMGDYLDDNVPSSFLLSEKQLSKIEVSNFQQEKRRIQDRGGICITLLARDYKDPKCVQIADLHYYNMDMPNRIYSPEGISPTLKTVSGGGGEVKVLKNKLYRKLTPKEYFRLMGFSDSDYQILVDNGISKSQLYKMAGNSIVVTVLENLFKQIYKPVTQSIASLKQQSLDILNNI